MSHKQKNTQNSSRNAATHGLSCEKFFLVPDETEEDFNAHAQIWFDEYKEYDSPLLKPLLTDAIQTHWLQKRAYRRLFQSETALAMAEMHHEPPEITNEIFKRLQLIQRYKTNYENSYQRALRALEAFRKSRNAEQLGRARLQNLECSTIAQLTKAHDRLVTRGYTSDEAEERIQKVYNFMNPFEKAPTSQNAESEPEA